MVVMMLLSTDLWCGAGSHSVVRLWESAGERRLVIQMNLLCMPLLKKVRLLWWGLRQMYPGQIAVSVCDSRGGGEGKGGRIVRLVCARGKGD